jgi:inosose dehydratase
MSRSLDRVAGAPITWGVCEVDGWGVQLPPERVLHEMASIGLRATERGPEGYLPTDPSRLRGLLADYELRLVGGFVPVTLHLGDELDYQLAAASRSADALAAAGADVLVLAATIGHGGYERSTDLDADEWKNLVRGIGRVVEISAQRALTVALHPHHGTIIQTPGHIYRLLESSSVSLCIDTGHLLIGGADPAEIARDTAARVAHAHLKDVDADLAEQVRAERLGYHDAVRRGLYRPLGQGDISVADVVGSLERSGYHGWYVLEQDAVLETSPDDGDGPLRDAVASLEFLRKTLLTETSVSR